MKITPKRYTKNHYPPIPAVTAETGGFSMEEALCRECQKSQFIAATKARFLAERDNSIRQRLAAAKLQEPIMQGHDLSGKKRFRPETRHMITLEVKNGKCA